MATALEELSARTRKFLERAVTRTKRGQTLFLTPEEAQIEGFDLPQGWQIKVTPQLGEHPPAVVFVTPEGREVDTPPLPTIQPAQEPIREFTFEERRRAELRLGPGGIQDPALQALIQPPEPLLRELFPLDRDIPALIDWINSNPEEALGVFQDIGRTPETEEILRLIGATETDLGEIFAPLEALPPEPEIEQPLPLVAWNAFILGGRQLLHRFTQFFVSVLPNQAFKDVKVGERAPIMVTPFFQPEIGHVYSQEEAARVNEFNKVMRDKYRKVYAENQVKQEEWLEKRPELQPPPRYKQDITQNPELLKDPAFWAYAIADAATFSLAVLGTTLGVGFATRNPYLGLAAGTAIATPSQSQDLFEDLIASGAPEDKASDIALPIGLVIASIEAITNIPLIRAISPGFKLFKQNIQKAVINRTLAGLFKKGITTAAIIETVEVLEEITQGAIHNAYVKTYDENRQVFENVDETVIRTLIATLPFAIFGGGMSMRHQSGLDASQVSPEQKKAEGWQLDRNTGQWYKPEPMVETYNEVVKEFQDAGLDLDEAKLKALNELARTPEGTKAIRDFLKVEKAVPKPMTRLEEEQIKQDIIDLQEKLKTAPVEERDAIQRRIAQNETILARGETLKGVTPTAERVAEVVPSGQQLAEARAKEKGISIAQASREIAEEAIAVGKPLAVEKPAVEEVPEKLKAEKPVAPTEAAPAVKEVEVPKAEIEVRRQFDELQKMADIWSKKLATREKVKSDLAKFVRENLPPNVRGRFVTSVAKVKTDAQLDRQMARVREVAEQNSQKVLKAEIRKELKKAQAVVKDKILKGKFTPDVQRRLDVLTHNLDLDRDVAREKMAFNMEAFDAGTLSYENMVNDNELLNFAGIEGMSSEELTNTLEYIKLLELIGKSDRQAKQEVATARIKATRTEISNILTGGKGLKTGIGAISREQLAAKPGWLDTFVNWQLGIDNLADKLSKFDTTSDPFQSELSKFVAQVHRATNRQVIGTKDAYNSFKGIIQEIYGVKSNREVNNLLNGLEEEVNLGTFELTEEYKATHPKATTVTIKMTRDELIAKYMQMQDSTLDNTFQVGMGWSQQVRNAVETNITVEEKKLSEAIFKFYEDYYTSINEIYGDLYNVDLSKNANYSPIRRDFEGDIAEQVLTLRDASQYASVLNSSLKARQKNIRPLRFNGATQILSNHIEQMEHFKAWATTMRDMRRVFGNTEIRQAIEQYHGRGIGQLIDTFLNQMARGGIETAATNRVADTLRRNFTKSILAIKPVIALKQIPSLFAYISEMNVTEFFTGIADYWSSPIKNFQFLLANSEMFKARMAVGFERDIRAAMEKHGKKAISGQGKLTDWFLLQIRLGDAFAVTQGMWAKYKAGLKQGLSQEEAIAAAEDTTSRTQPSFGIDTLSAIQNSGSWLKLMTMFQNQPNKYFRIVGDNMRNFKYGRGSRAKAASTILLTWVILPMMFQFIADAFQWKPARQARAGILGPLNFILIGGQLVQSMWGWLTDQPFDYQVSPVAQTGRDLQMIFLKARKLIGQGQDPYKDISTDDMASLVEYLAKAIGQVTGLPTPYFVQVEKLIRHKIQAGEEIGVKDFLFSEWALQPPEKKAGEKVEDLNLLLGEPEEGAEDKPLTDKPLRMYDTADWFRDIGKVYSNVLPQDVLDDPNASKESKAWAQYEIARSKADILPNIPLYKINTDDNEDTIINYYEQWKARERQETLADLNEFDKLYPKSYLGNVTRQQYNILLKYLEAEDKDAFLEAHPELRENPREDWLRTNPTDNAYLVLGGQAKLQTMAAYKEAQRLINELDIPEDGIPDLALPPEGSVENYFKYNEAVAEFSANSWETQLIIAEDDALRVFLDRELIETPVRALELKIKHRELSDLYAAYGDRESLSYIEDDDAREDGRDKLKTDNPKWVDDMRRIEAIENEASDDIVEQWAERGKMVDEFSGGSSEVKVWLLDHPETHKWALDQELLTDDGSDWNEPVLRINAKWRIQDNEYDVLETTEARKTYLAEHEDYRKDRRRRDAFGLESPSGEKFPGIEIENYVNYYELPEKGFRQERFLLENPEFAKAMHDIKGIDLPTKVPAVQYDEIYERFQKDFDKLEGFSDFNSPHYIGNPEKREEARDAMRFDFQGRLLPFGVQEIRRDAYGKFVPENHIESYVGYYSILAAGKPDDWDNSLGWYEDDWFFMEHMDFYKEVYLGLLKRERKDFRNVPTREVFRFYQVYISLPKGDMRTNYRIDHPELDEWLVLAKGYTPVADREKAQIDRYEEQIAEFTQAMDARLKDLQERIRRLLRGT